MHLLLITVAAAVVKNCCRIEEAKIPVGILDVAASSWSSIELIAAAVGLS